MTAPDTTAFLARGFAQWLGAHAPASQRESVQRAARLLVAAASRGHTCLATTAPDPVVLQEAGVTAEQLAELRAQLPQGMPPVVTAPGGGPAPLLWDGERLYLWRLWRAEQSLAGRLRAMLSSTHPDVDEAALAASLARLIPGDQPGAGAQRAAARAAVERRLSIITGGPGTGKTWTLARALMAIQENRAGARHPASPGPGPTDSLRILLGAPTGKAAGRMAASLADAGVEDPPPATTVHRLLGYQPWRDAFHHGAGRPLPADVLIVDEVSMVELPLLERLLAAAPDHARVVLLGDPDQLASVGIGQVLGDVCRMVDEGSAPASWGGAVVQLTHSRRFAPDRGIGALARACRQGDGDAAAHVLGVGGGQVHHWPSAATVLDLPPVTEGLDRWLRDRAGTDPLPLLQHLEQWQVLCALRNGPRGVAGAVAAIHSHLRQQGVPEAGREVRLHGLPILITNNDPEAQLSNGDVGVLWRQPGQGDQPERWLGWFRSLEDPRRLRSIPAAMLPAWEPAWALTVHKSQGSEYDAVAVVLPEGVHPLATRELVYTALTRARSEVHVMGSKADLRAAVARGQRRGSGLVEALRSRVEAR